MDLTKLPSINKGSKKLEPLTQNELDLINNNYEEVERILRSVFSKNLRKTENVDDKTMEALGYLPFVAKEYKVEEDKRNNFAKCAASRCILRLIDDFRNSKKLLKSIKRKMAKEKHLKFSNFDDNTISIKGSLDFPLSIDGVSVRSQAKFEGFEEVDIKDSVNGILKKSEKVFFEDDNEFSRVKNKSSKIHKAIIRDYILPRINRKDFKSLDIIGEEFGVTLERIRQILHGRRMKRFMKEFIDEEI